MFHGLSLTSGEEEHQTAQVREVSVSLEQERALNGKLTKSLPLRSLFWLGKQLSPALNFVLRAVRWDINTG